MMNFRYPVIIAVLVVLTAMAVSGCTSTTTTSPAVSTQPAASGTPAVSSAPATASSAPSTSVLSNLASAFDKSKLHWYEYKMTSAAGTSTMRMDYGVSYNGQTADKMSMNAQMNQGGSNMTTVITIYSANGQTLGGHMQTLQDGKVLYDNDIPASGTSTTGSSSASNPFDTNSGVALTNAGLDSVTVPAGTYAATKYTFTDTSGNSGTVWVAPNVPVPVKYSSSSGGQTVALELNGWG